MKAPHIYGSESKCRAAIARYIESGEEVLDRAVGVRDRIETAKKTRPKNSVMPLILEEKWAQELRRWFITAARGMGRYLQLGQ